jgi:hypothetical protein
MKVVSDNSVQLNSVVVLLCAGSATQVPILKPAQKPKHNTKQFKYTKRKTLNSHSKTGMTAGGK